MLGIDESSRTLERFTCAGAGAGASRGTHQAHGVSPPQDVASHASSLFHDSEVVKGTDVCQLLSFGSAAAAADLAALWACAPAAAADC